jgi:hypothetical protein
MIGAPAHTFLHISVKARRHPFRHQVILIGRSPPASDGTIRVSDRQRVEVTVIEGRAAGYEARSRRGFERSEHRTSTQNRTDAGRQSPTDH